jgi:hypothetical protein
VYAARGIDLLIAFLVFQVSALGPRSVLQGE